MVNKQSRSEIRVKKHNRIRVTVLLAQQRDRVWQCLEVIIICMLKLSTIRLVTPWLLLPQLRKK